MVELHYMRFGRETMNAFAKMRRSNFSVEKTGYDQYPCRVQTQPKIS